MALIQCPECGKDVSDKARACPHCGYEINPVIQPEMVEANKIKVKKKKPMSPEQKKRLKKLFIFIPAGLVVLFVAYLFLSPITLKFCCIHRKQDATCTTPQMCKRCGKTWGSANGHTWIEATCTEPKTCKVCREKEGSPLGHDFKAATCTEPKTCKLCGLTEGKATGHSWVGATCEKAKHCSRCNKKEGSPLGHDVHDLVCSRCKETIIRNARTEVPKVIDITNLTYRINSVGGIDQNMNFVNKSSTKTINYITMNVEFFNSVGDVIADAITGKKSVNLQYTGPIKPGGRSGIVKWDACFYNGNFSGTMHFNEIKIDYSDGTTLVLDEYSTSYAVKDWR